MKKTLIVLFLFLFLYSCGVFHPRFNWNQGGPEKRSYIENLSFQYLKDKIILPVTINGETRHFIFDTGAPTIISKSLQEELTYEILGKGEVSDINLNRDSVTMVRIDSLFLGDVKFSNIPAMVSDLNVLPWYCFSIDGFIGSNLLRNSAVQINLKENKFVVTNDAAKLSNLGNKNSMMLDRQSSPYIKFSVDREKDKYVLFDSGSDDFVNLSLDYFEELRNNREGFDIEKTGYGNGIMGLFGTGRQGKVYQLKLDSLRFDQTTITEPMVEVTNTKDKLGARLFRYGVVTLDFRNEKFYFYSNKSTMPFDEPENSELGFRPILRQDTFRVGLVWEHSLVDSLGLEPGNEIIRINRYNFRDSLKSSFCKILLEDSLHKVNVFDIRYIDENGDFKRIKMRRKD
jgi:hypothetical protein